MCSYFIFVFVFFYFKYFTRFLCYYFGYKLCLLFYCLIYIVFMFFTQLAVSQQLILPLKNLSNTSYLNITPINSPINHLSFMCRYQKGLKNVEKMANLIVSIQQQRNHFFFFIINYIFPYKISNSRGVVKSSEN